MIVSKITKYVMYLEDHENPSPNEEWGWGGAGWYWEDEVGFLNGVYATEEQAIAVFERFLIEVLGITL